MDKQKIFISSVQKEFKAERLALREYITHDPLFSRYFEVFLFEDVPARDRDPNSIYLAEVRACGLFICLVGNEYGAKNDRGVSATEQEYCEATEHGKTRLLFIKDGNDSDRHRKTRRFVRKAASEIVRRRFANTSELIAQVYAALVQYLEDEGILQTDPFDAAVCRNARFSDIDGTNISSFLESARDERKFPLPKNT